MSLMKRISLIFRSKANKALDKAEDPRETLDYSYQRQLELLSKVRRGVADVATSRKRVELQVNQLEQQAAKLQGQAEKAIGAGREDLAVGHGAVTVADPDPLAGREPQDVDRVPALGAVDEDVTGLGEFVEDEQRCAPELRDPVVRGGHLNASRTRENRPPCASRSPTWAPWAPAAPTSTAMSACAKSA